MPCDIEHARLSCAVLLLGTLAFGWAASCASPDASVQDDQMATDQHADDEHSDDEHEDEAGRVTLTETAFASAGIVVETVTVGVNQGLSGRLDVPGEVVLDPRRVAMVSPRVHGIIGRLDVAPGMRIASGEPVAQLFSREFLNAQRDYQRAAARMAVDTSDAARSVETAARSRLALMGVPDEEIERLTVNAEQREFLPVTAPLNGTVLEVLALTGTAVEPGQPIARIADLSVVYVTAEIAEAQLRNVQRGLRAEVQLVAYPDMVLTGQVERIHDELNTETRRARAYIAVQNPRRLLKPGMFATVSFVLNDAVETAGAMTTTIPIDAVLRDETGPYVYVEVAPLTFERRTVEIASNPPSDLAKPASDRIVVLGGLAQGERIVTSGAFALKSEIAKGSFGEHAH